MTKMNREEAIKFSQFVAMMDEVDFGKGEGKVVVFKNAVAILEQAEDDPESVQLQFVINKYTDARDIEIVDEISIEDMIKSVFEDKE